MTRRGQNGFGRGGNLEFLLGSRWGHVLSGSAGIRLCLVLLLGGFVGFAAGCKRQPSTAVTPAPPVPGQAELASNAPGGSASAPVSVPPVAADPASAPDLTQINQAYIGWIMQSRKHVKTVEEYISASGAQLPAPPAGKKYIIDHNGYIALVKR